LRLLTQLCNAWSPGSGAATGTRAKLTPVLVAAHGGRGASRRKPGKKFNHGKGASRREPSTARSLDATTSKYRVIATLTVAAVFVAAIFSLARMETPSSSQADPAANTAVQAQPGAQAKSFSGFSFYSLLKDFEIEVPEPDPQDTAGASAAKRSYVIQAGSFKTAAQAESRLAELILLGLEPTVGEVTNANGERWHRVMLGPFDSRSQMASARSVIISNNIEAMVMQRKQQ